MSKYIDEIVKDIRKTLNLGQDLKIGAYKKMILL